MLRFEDALARIVALGVEHAPDAGAARESVALEDADGRVLGEDLTSSVDLPRSPASAADGYAVRSSDLTGEMPLRLTVQGQSRSAASPEALAAGTAMRVALGASLPHGADAVIAHESVARQGEVVVVTSRPRAGQLVRRPGEELAAGTIAVARGTRLRPGHLALASALDRAELAVVARPRVSILAIGDELRRPGTDAVPGTLPESITLALRAAARRAGATTRPHAFVREEPAAMERAIAASCAGSDVVVVASSSSGDEHETLWPSLQSLGVRLELWRIAIKPSKPFAVGLLPREGGRDAIVLGLPGNAASVMVLFAAFVVPLLRALQGDARPFPPHFRARMTRAHAHDPGRLELALGMVAQAESGLSITTLPGQASGAVTSLAHANALACIPESASGVGAGDEVDVLLLADLCG